MRRLDSQEQFIIELLEQAWNEYLKMNILHLSDRDEFLRCIHGAQNIVMARPIVQEMYMEDKPMEKV